MANDPGPATDAPRWYVVASLVCIRVARVGMRIRVLSLRRALRMTAPWHEAAVLAGIKLPERFYETAAEAGLRLPGAPAR